LRFLNNKEKILILLLCCVIDENPPLILTGKYMPDINIDAIVEIKMFIFLFIASPK